MEMTASKRLALSSSLALPKVPRLRRPISKPAPSSMEPMAASADGLAKFTGALGRPRFAEAMVAGDDFFTCWGDDRGPWGENAACATEKGVETWGVAAAPCCGCEGVRPCCDTGSFPGVGVDDMAAGVAHAVLAKSGLSR
jgi:hypothetical protein